MRILLNGSPYETNAVTLEGLLDELALDTAVVATALNSVFVAKTARSAISLKASDAIEVLSPMQGG